jgi:HEAT repeats
MVPARPGDNPTSAAQGQSVRRGASRPAIELRGDLLSVRLRNVPWEAVLKELHRQTGITVHVEGQIAGTLTEEFEDWPLEKGLRALFRNVNSVFFYTAGKDASAAMLTRLWLFPKERMTAAMKQRHHAVLGPAAVQQDDHGSPREIELTLAHEGEASLEGESVAEPYQEGQLEAAGVSAQAGNEAALEQAVAPSDQSTPAKALELSAERGLPETTAVPANAIESEEPARRLQVLELLHQNTQADENMVVSGLSQALNDEDVAVKGYAIQALGERGEPSALESLRQAFRNPDSSIRMMILASVVHSDQGRPLLEEALMDNDPTVRSFAAFWLEQAVAEGR